MVVRVYISLISLIVLGATYILIIIGVAVRLVLQPGRGPAGGRAGVVLRRHPTGSRTRPFPGLNHIYRARCSQCAARVRPWC